MARLLDQLLGHEQPVSKLLKAIELGRLNSAYTFIGPSGIGKKLVARSISQVLACPKEKLGCGTCDICLRVEKRNSEAVLIIDSPTQQIRIEDARAIHDFLSLKTITQNRSVIIDNAHLLNPQASNSLLKILEEPPPNTYFFLITHNWDDLLPTIKSRTAPMRFAPLTSEVVRILATRAWQGETESSAMENEAWLVNACQGRFDLYKQLKNPRSQELRLMAADFLSQFAPATKGLKTSKFDVQLKAIVGEREDAQYFAQMLQELVRDILISKYQNELVVHQDLQSRIAHLISLDDQTLHTLYSNSLSLENEFTQNLDRVLALENFEILARTALREE